MPHQIVFRERYGALGRKVIYVKPPDQNSLVRLGSSVALPTTFFEMFLQFFRQVFLPQGYPESVSEDYSKYQLWDTLQAFCSTVTGTLTTQAIMKGVGVGDTAATPFAAAITWILKDGTGMIGRILFAWIQGTRLDGACKKWRLFADFLNDVAMGLELLLPMFLDYSTTILCISTAMKSIVGVAGGATRAAITQHQAVRNNMADVSAKDGSQETFVNLCASFAGILIIATFDEGEFVWQLFTIFTLIHLFANYKAVRSLTIVTLNNERLILLLRTFMVTEAVSSPEIVNKYESVILGKGMSDVDLCGFRIALGASLQNVVKKKTVNAEDVMLLANFYRSKKYLIVVDMKKRTLFVSCSAGEESVDVIQGYFHAAMLGIAICSVQERPLKVLKSDKIRPPIDSSPVHQLQCELLRLCNMEKIPGNQRIPLEAMMAAEDMVNVQFPQFLNVIQKQGWKTGSHHLTVDEWRGEWKNFQLSGQST